MADENYDNGKGIEYVSPESLEKKQELSLTGFRKFEFKQQVRDAAREAEAREREKANQPTPEWADLMESLKDAGLEPNMG